VLECVADVSSFTLMCYAFGEAPFSDEKLHVCRYGREANFTAIITTTPNFSLVGLSPAGAGEKKTLERLAVERCKTSAHFYGRIVTENNFRNGYFLSPAAHYCSISNLPVVKTKGLVLAETDALIGESYDDIGQGWDEQERQYQEEVGLDLSASSSSTNNPVFTDMRQNSIYATAPVVANLPFSPSSARVVNDTIVPLPIVSPLQPPQGVQPQPSSMQYAPKVQAPQASLPPESDSGIAKPLDDGEYK